MLRDFPLFTTENGVASLKMREIPYSGSAYITIRDSLQPTALLEDCVGFCRAVGAEYIYATGHTFLEAYPIHTQIYKMQVSRESLDETDACVFPVTEQTVQRFREFYNEKMSTVPNASYMTQSDAREILRDGSAYFIHRDGDFLGIAIGSGSEIFAIASNIPGSGKTLVSAISHVLTGDTITLEVASANEQAIRLYEKLGFYVCQSIATWYKIL